MPSRLPRGLALTPGLRRLHLALLLSASALSAAVVGTNPPSLPLTGERIASLPAAEQSAWQRYLATSQALRTADQTAVVAEMKAAGLREALVPAAGNGDRGMPLGEPLAWYAGEDARHRADNITSYQTPAGGWSKNFNPAARARALGETFSHDSNVKLPPPDAKDTPPEFHWSYVGTFDNNATTTPLHFLAKVATAAGSPLGAAWRAAFLHGLEYICAAQYPNGGWPQVYPLDGGYHDAVTFNDGAFAHIVTLLRAVAGGENEFAFVPPEWRTRAAISTARGLACILRTQIVVDGRRTGWGQQHDVLALVPTSARAYEMPSISSGESAGVAIFLMSLEDPSPEVVGAVHAVAAWFEHTKLSDVEFRRAPSRERTLVAVPGAEPLWARFIEIGTHRPIFGDRDRSIHDDVSEISVERRNGYAWYGTNPSTALKRYATWAQAHPAP